MNTRIRKLVYTALFAALTAVTRSSAPLAEA